MSILKNWISQMDGENLEEYLNSFNPKYINDDINTTLRIYSLEMLNIYFEDLEINEDQELYFDREYFEILMILLMDIKYSQVKILILNIIHGLTFFSEEVCGYLMTYDNISYIYNLIEEGNIRELNFSLQIFGNILVRIENAFNEIYKYVPIEVKVKELLLSKKYENIQEIISNLIWLLKLIVKNTNTESYVNVNNLTINI